ncbi:peptide-N-glycosidase F-related protein [Nannocystaceae bacterium ST9]
MRLAALLRVVSGSCFAIVVATIAACGGPAAEGDDEVMASDESSSESGDTSTSDDTGSASDETTTGEPLEPEVIWLMEDVVYYDGYAETVDEPVPEGVIRHRNSLNAIKLSDEQLASIQNTLKVGVIVGALCDNYDRIGSVHLALVPKGASTYVPEEVDRIEVARFITPFMDMNDDPKTVPYEWDANGVAAILKDDDLMAAYDAWFELAIFGVPYAANTEIAGCAGRNDTQLGSLLLYTDSMQAAEQFDVLLPLAIEQSFNNYAEGASDAIGMTRKTIAFEMPDTANAQLVLITSNHGANAGGEEYIRREHYVYVDGALALQYKPGRTSCEPFRVYNTQGNGIYGPSPMSDEEWQSFSNWCPGDIIDTRVIPWGAVEAGMHEFVIDVPDAVFADGQGDFPFSLYVQAE